jgi:hypothetical protein
MKRTIQTLAMLMAIALAVVWMAGCGDEEEEMVLAAFTGAAPAGGSEIAANQEITLNFDNPAFNVTVDGSPATGSGKVWKWKGTLAEGAVTINVAWENEDGSETDSASVQYTVTAADTTAPSVVSSDPEDGDKDVDPESINEDGMEIKFSEPVSKLTVDVTIDGDALKWATELSDDKMTASVLMLAGGELPYEAEVILVVNAEDATGNKLEDFEITFTTAAKEE